MTTKRRKKSASGSASTRSSSRAAERAGDIEAIRRHGEAIALRTVNKHERELESTGARLLKPEEVMNLNERIAITFAQGVAAHS